MSHPGRFHRQSNRWQAHDYATGGTYFVTLVTEGRVCAFGEVCDGAIRLNAIGRFVDAEWMVTGVVRSDVEIDVFCVMPNHLHGLITIRPPDTPMIDRGGLMAERAHSGVPLRAKRSLSSIIAQFKATSTRRISEMRGTQGQKVWQRGFHDRVVRSQDEFDRIADYIVTNPERWESDDHHP